MNERKDGWLDRMLDAALGEDPASAAPPDFDSIRAETKKRGDPDGRRGDAPHRSWLAAAAIAAAAAVAVPAAVVGYRAVERNRAVREEHRLLAEELIGGTIFDEGLLLGEPWPADIAEPGESFDI